MKKLNQLLLAAGLAGFVCLGATSALAQNDQVATPGGGAGISGGDGNNGGRRFGGNFDPAQVQQRIMDNVKEQLGFTNETDWSAVQPLVLKVMDARRDVGFGGGLGRMFGRGNRGGAQGGPGGGIARMLGTPSPEAEALQKAVDDNTPPAQIKELLAKYQASQKTKRAKLEQAQSDLRAILTTKQEASATLLGWLN